MQGPLWSIVAYACFVQWSLVQTKALKTDKNPAGLVAASPGLKWFIVWAVAMSSLVGCKPRLEMVQSLSCGDVFRQLVPQTNTSWEEGMLVYLGPAVWLGVP